MSLRFVARAELFANKREVIMRVGIAWIESHGVAKMQSRRLESADLFKNAAQIEMGQSILGIDLQSTHEIFGCFFQVPVFVAKRSAIEQSIDFLWINAQSMIVRFDCLRPGIFLGVIFERGG